MATPQNWAQAQAAVVNILGKEAKVPAPKVNLGKYSADSDKLAKEYAATVTVLQAKILALQNAQSSWKNAIKQVEDQMDASDFGLDEKDADDKKKIEQAHKLLSDYFDEQMQVCDDNIKNLDELDKHTMAISKYRP